MVEGDEQADAGATAEAADHMPANRQEAIHAREGLPLSRKTICSWHLQLADLSSHSSTR